MLGFALAQCPGHYDHDDLYPRLVFEHSVLKTRFRYLRGSMIQCNYKHCQTERKESQDTYTIYIDKHYKYCSKQAQKCSVMIISTVDLKLHCIKIVSMYDITDYDTVRSIKNFLYSTLSIFVYSLFWCSYLVLGYTFLYLY